MTKLSLRFGALAAAVAALQPWLLLILGEPDVSTLATLAANPTKSQQIFWIMLFFIPAMFVAYWVATVDQSSSHTLCSSFALLFFALWFALELLPRSFDLWVVQKRWLNTFISAGPAQRALLENSYSLYRDVLYGLVFVRRHALLLSQLCLAFLVRRNRPWGVALTIALSLSVFRLALGSLSSYAGWKAAGVIADPLYFVTSGLVFPLLFIWLWLRKK